MPKKKRAAPTKNCPACGKPNHARRKNCEHCGALMPAADKSNGTKPEKVQSKRPVKKASPKKSARRRRAVSSTGNITVTLDHIKSAASLIRQCSSRQLAMQAVDEAAEIMNLN